MGLVNFRTCLSNKAWVNRYDEKSKLNVFQRADVNESFLDEKSKLNISQLVDSDDLRWNEKEMDFNSG